MKRHTSLAPLSREHHAALILARLLQKGAPLYKGLPVEPEEKAKYGFKFYQEEMIRHFEEEEKILKLIKGTNNDLDELTETIFKEHEELHKLFQSIIESPELINHQDTLGKKLEAHVRKEERVLFPLIQETCSEEIMTEINKVLSDNS